MRWSAGSAATRRTSPALERLFGALTGNPARYTGQFFAVGRASTERYRLKDESYSIFGQVDFEVTDRLTLTGGLNYTHDKKRYSVNVVSTDVFANLNLPALRSAATQPGIAQTVGGILGVPGGFANAAQIGAFAAAQPAAFAQIQAGAAAATAPLLAAASAAVPAAVPEHAQRGRAGQDQRQRLTYTARAAYDITDSSTSMPATRPASRRARSTSRATAGRRRPIARRSQAAGLAFRQPDLGTRFAEPEEATVYEVGLKANWASSRSTSRCSTSTIKGFQSNIFTGTGFVLPNAGKQSVRGSSSKAPSARR